MVYLRSLSSFLQIFLQSGGSAGDFATNAPRANRNGYTEQTFEDSVPRAISVLVCVCD